MWFCKHFFSTIGSFYEFFSKICAAVCFFIQKYDKAKKRKARTRLSELCASVDKIMVSIFFCFSFFGLFSALLQSPVCAAALVLAALAPRR